MFLTKIWNSNKTPRSPPNFSYRICYKMANYGQISDFKMYIEVSWQNPSISYFRIFKNCLPSGQKNKKKNFWDFFSSIHVSLKLLYSLCFLTYMKMVNSKWFYGPGTTTFAHTVFISPTFVTQSFNLKMTYFRHRHSRRKSALFRCKLLNKIQK